LHTTEGSGAPADFHVFFETEYERLGKALYLVTGNRHEAEDLAQEALVRVFERWDRVSATDSPTGYLYRTALNLQRSRVRRLRTALRHSMPQPSHTDPLDRVDAQNEVMQLLLGLPLGQRTAMVLVDWYGMSAEEASSVMRIKPSTVRVHLSRAHASLRDPGGDDD
jgi:RNA polymerase sigma-70 factor (ECF subfamily)